MTYTKTYTFSESVAALPPAQPQYSGCALWTIECYVDFIHRYKKSDGTIASDAEATANPSLIDKTGFDYWTNECAKKGLTRDAHRKAFRDYLIYIGVVPYA